MIRPTYARLARVVSAQPRQGFRSFFWSKDPDKEAEEVPVEREHQPVDPKLLEILCCPFTKEPLAYDRSKGELVSDKLSVAFPIAADGVPNMIPTSARFTNQAEGDEKAT